MRQQISFETDGKCCGLYEIHKLLAGCNQLFLRRSSEQQDVNTRELDTKVCTEIFVALFQKFRHGMNFTVSILALYNNTQTDQKSPTEDKVTKRN